MAADRYHSHQLMLISLALGRLLLAGEPCKDSSDNSMAPRCFSDNWQELACHVDTGDQGNDNGNNGSSLTFHINQFK